MHCVSPCSFAWVDEEVGISTIPQLLNISPNPAYILRALRESGARRILRNILCRHWRWFLVLPPRIIDPSKLLAQLCEPPGTHLPVGIVVTEEQSLLSEGGDKTDCVHCKLNYVVYMDTRVVMVGSTGGGLRVE